MHLSIRVKNYRCFGAQSSAGFVLKQGITGFVGENNTGKSTMLRLFYDLRGVFRKAANQLDQFRPGREMFFQMPPLPAGIERNRFFHQKNGDALVVEIASEGSEIVLVCRRDGRVQWSLGHHLPEDTGMAEDLRMLSRMFYVGPFRPFQACGLDGVSFDLRFGREFFDACSRAASGGHPEEKKSLDSVCLTVSELFDLEQFAFQNDSQGHPGFLLNGSWMGAEELGSGMGQCFLILFQAARHHPSFVLIDEPEAHLHPSIQTDFLTQLAGYGQYGLIISTHHSGVAQSASDHLYRVKRHAEREGSVIEPFQPESRLSQTLGEMQVSLQSQKNGPQVLLVEGPTEIKALRKLMAKINRHHSVVLLPLGGSSMINGHREDELREVKKICSSVYALIDSERDSPEARESAHHRAFREACHHAGIHCHILERRSLENYFSGRAIHQVLGRKFRELGPYENVNTVHSRWPKSENWKIVQQMRPEEFEGTDLWEFCRELVAVPKSGRQS